MAVKYLIDRDMLRDWINVQIRYSTSVDRSTLDQMLKTVSEMQIVKIETVQMITRNDDGVISHICPACLKRVGAYDNYCKNCGAKFEGETYEE